MERRRNIEGKETISSIRFGKKRKVNCIRKRRKYDLQEEKE